MKIKLGFGSVIDAIKIQVARMGKPGLDSIRFRIWSRWQWEHYRKKNGIYRLVDEWENGNLCTDQGLTDNLGVHFSGDTQKTSWFLCTFEDNHTPAAGDTYAVPGYTECTAITEATRPQWSEAGAAAKAISNTASKATFTYNASKTIYGGSLVGGGSAEDTKGDTAGGGVLFCESQFTGGSKAVVNTDILKVSVSLSVTDT